MTQNGLVLMSGDAPKQTGLALTPGARGLQSDFNGRKFPNARMNQTGFDNI